MAARTGAASRKRTSATIRNSATALNTMSLDMADGPCLKKGGGVRSRVPSGMSGKARGWGGQAGNRRWGLFAGEDGAQALHALQGHAAATHDAGQRLFGHQHRQTGFF